MLNSVKKPIATPAIPVFDERYPCLEVLNDNKRLLDEFRHIYQQTNDPSVPLAVLCTAVDAARDAELVTLPTWAGRLLAAGFAQYLEAVSVGDRSVSLEQCLGIDKVAKSDIADLATLDEMSKRVHWFRWQFRLKLGVACHVVYSLHIDQCKYMGLSPDKVGITRDEKSFKQHYERKHAKQFPVWQAELEAQGCTPTDESRAEALSMLPTIGLVHLVTKEIKKAKTPA